MSTDAQQRRGRPILADVGGVIAARQRSVGKHYSLSEKSLGYDLASESKPYVDRSMMFAKAVISTATKDRVGDVLNPKGCNLENYSKNPVVLWGHGIEGIVLPIGSSTHADGSLAIDILEDRVEGGCYFSQSSLEASQIFELIDEGVVRATSVRETPIKSRMTVFQGEQVLMVDEWDLEEWSWCAIGVNPDAVAKALDRNKLGGQPITESILKSLRAVAPEKKAVGVGFSEMKSMADDKQDPDKDDDKDTPISGDMTKPADDETGGGGGGNDGDSAKYGAQALAALHGAITAALQGGEKSIGAMEHPTATPGMRGVLDQLKDLAEATRGLHSECYPAATLKDDMTDDTDDSEMKAFFSSVNIGRYTLAGLGSRVKSFTTDKNLTPSQKRQLADVANGIDRLVTQAKSYKPVQVEKPVEKKPDGPTAEEKLQAELDALKAEMSR